MRLSIIFRLLIIFFTALLLAFGLLWLVRLIPSKSIKGHIYESAIQLNEEGLYPKYETALLKLDNYTDALMMNICYSSDNSSLIEQIFTSPYCLKEDKTPIEILLEISTDSKDDHPEYQNLEYYYYGRYWQGYQITLKPLLIILNYKEIRVLNIILVLILFLWSLWLIKKKLTLYYMLFYFLSFFIFYLPIGPFSLQISTCFIITLIAVVITLSMKKNILENNVFSIFLLIGIATSFFDFLTTPIITLCIPLIIYGGIKKGLSIKRMFLLTIDWGVGYALFWIIKWIIAFYLSDIDILGSAIDSVKLRTGGEIAENISAKIIDNYFILIYGIIISVYLLSFWKIYQKTVRQKIDYIFFKKNIYLFIISFYPFLWFLILKNHSILHFWFTYRALSVTFFALSIFYLKMKNNENKEYKNCGADTLL